MRDYSAHNLTDDAATVHNWLKEIDAAGQLRAKFGDQLVPLTPLVTIIGCVPGQPTTVGVYLDATAKCDPDAPLAHKAPDRLGIGWVQFHSACFGVTRQDLFLADGVTGELELVSGRFKAALAEMKPAGLLEPAAVVQA